MKAIGTKMRQSGQDITHYVRRKHITTAMVKQYCPGYDYWMGIGMDVEDNVKSKLRFSCFYMERYV